MKPLRHPWTIRGLLVLAIEVMALASLWLRDLPLAAMLQVLAVLVLSVHQLDRNLPGGVDRVDADTGASGCRSVTGVAGSRD